MVRKATSMKEINERREAAENLQRLEHANREQAKTIKELELKFNALTIDYRTVLADKKELDQCIDKLLHDAPSRPTGSVNKKHPSQMNAAELRAYVQSPDAQIAGLQEKVNYLNKLTWGPNSHESRLQELERFKDQIDVADDIIAERMQILEERLNSLAKDYEGTCRTLRENNLTASDPPKYRKDDPFLAHEALDRTNMVMEVLYDHVEQHPFVLMHPEILEKIVQAGELLASAYQDIGNAS